MYLSYETKLKIESIAWKLANLDVDPIFFLEAYMQYKAPVVLNEQELTNWWQNIKNYVKGGADAYFAGQVDIKRKYEEAKQGLNAIVNLLKAGPYKDKLDPTMEKQLIDHLEDVVVELGRADQHVDKLNDRIRQSHKEKKMYGKDVAHAQTMPSNFFDGLQMMNLENPSIDGVIAWIDNKDPDSQTLLLQNAQFLKKRFSRKITDLAQRNSSKLARLAAKNVLKTPDDQMLAFSYSLSKVLENAMPEYNSYQVPFDNINKFTADIANKLKTMNVSLVKNYMSRPLIQGNTLDSAATAISRNTNVVTAFNSLPAPMKAEFNNDVVKFSKLVIYLRGISQIIAGLAG